jgi:hypothetical protein
VSIDREGAVRGRVMGVTRKWARRPVLAALALSVGASGRAGELTRGALCREDVVRVEILGHGSATGRLLGVENDVLLLAKGKKVKRVPIAGVTRVWRDDGVHPGAANREAGVLAGLAAASVAAATMPVDATKDSRALQDKNEAGPIAARAAVVGTILRAISSGVRNGSRSRHWTEVSASELKSIDTKPVIEELTVDTEQLREPEPVSTEERAVEPKPTPDEKPEVASERSPVQGAAAESGGQTSAPCPGRD